ncbi:FapA family protein [Peribacillus simplex]|uniref:FapA family protein n=1 Tax=Peribacillus simplex TaxID=1478 RepID=UPI003D2D666F
MIDGVVEFREGKIAVGDHLLIDGDIGNKTGNIEFNGSVTIKGTVIDHFSVTATKDISILSELGVSNVKEIKSTEGDVFIKGGIFGKGVSKISAARNIFVKHANECHLTAGENIHIGSYSLGSFLKAKNIFTDEKKGKLIGGVIEAHGKVRAAVIGNRMERKTLINVKGFNRALLREELNETLLLYKSKIMRLQSIKEKLDVYDMSLGQLNGEENFQYEQTRNQFERLMAQIYQLDEKRKSIMDLLESKGEGEITIAQMAFPDTRLQIKCLEKKLSDLTKGTFYAENNHLHFDLND